MESLRGGIKKVVDGRGFWVWVDYPKTYQIGRRKIKDCEIILTDARLISTTQRQAIWMTLKDVGLFTGYESEEIKEVMKYFFLISSGAAESFSLSCCDMTTANEFLMYLIEFCLKHNVPTKGPLLKRCPNIGRFVYLCAIHKKSCITQLPAELHHVDAVGMGRDRTEIIHKGMRIIPLTREEHTEAHKIGLQTFLDKHHIEPVKMDDDLCRVWGLKGE